MEILDVGCECGNVGLAITGNPIFRVYCHCQICQRFNNAAFADIVVYNAEQVSVFSPEGVKFESFKKPPNIQRGKCTKCHMPVIEKLAAPVIPKLSFVPVSAHRSTDSLPQSIAHLFYERRISDSDDALPKYKGYISSQIAFARSLLVRM